MMVIFWWVGRSENSLLAMKPITGSSPNWQHRPITTPRLCMDAAAAEAVVERLRVEEL